MTRIRSTFAVVATCLLMLVPSWVDTSTQAQGIDVLVGVTQLIVRIVPAVTTIGIVNTAAGTTTAATSIGQVGAYLVNLAPGADVGVTSALILALPGVAGVAPNTRVKAPGVDQSRIYAWRIYAWSNQSPVPVASQYALPRVSLPQALQVSTGRGVTIAVLDTGVQLDPTAHVGLASVLVPGHDFVDGDSIPAETRNGIDDDGNGLIDEGIGHGTHVAGIVHQAAPQAWIMPVRVLDDDGGGTMWNVAEGMFWAAQHGAKIINMSLGTHGSAKVLRDAVETVTAQGVLVVAAAGNDGADRPNFPAAAPLALAVGSVGAGDIVSKFSNYGRWIDVVAPGEDIHSTYAFPSDSYAMNSGTSMATPWVAGEAALLLARNPSLSPAGITTAIKAGAQSIDVQNPSLVGSLGAGRVDFAASLRLG